MASQLRIVPDLGSPVTICASVRVIIESLWATGLFGKTPADTCERIISDWLLENPERLARLGINLPSLKPARKVTK